ncbi:acetate/propionate family kinase [Candidatus Dojkabacteria bacterium]|nr:acetate/propionate family kinase [Candidatus Dojkabacteria bacterium]
MMTILAVNAGSETMKFKIFDKELNSVSKGKIFTNNGKYFFRINGEEIETGQKEYDNPMNLIRCSIQAKIDKVGFRIVHGGEKYLDPILLTDRVVSEIEELNDLAPLHNPPALKRVKEFKEQFPSVPVYGVFDTAFHKSIPKKAYLYGLPYDFYEKYRIRKYGFHGISNRFVLDELNIIEPGHSRVIVCHLGGGSSITAIKDGRSIDTSMGFTPLDGLMMATRSGDVDDGVVFHLNRKFRLSLDMIADIENNNSGLLGISEISDDMRVLLTEEGKGNIRAKLAIEMYIYRVQKYIGSFTTALGGVDVLVFTAGIGEGSDIIRKRICENLSLFGIEISDSLNEGKKNVRENLKISKNISKSVWVIPTDEELQIAREISTLE